VAALIATVRALSALPTPAPAPLATAATAATIPVRSFPAVVPRAIAILLFARRAAFGGLGLVGGGFLGIESTGRGLGSVGGSSRRCRGWLIGTGGLHGIGGFAIRIRIDG
jgi:hypothetical protein